MFIWLLLRLGNIPAEEVVVPPYPTLPEKDRLVAVGVENRLVTVASETRMVEAEGE